MIKFLLGRQTDPLQEKILDEAVKIYKQNPEHETFVIIPNHIKFTTEVKAINKLANINKQTETSVKNLQVLSFSRLAWYFLKDAEKGLPTQLDDAAAAMLLGQIINNRKDDLVMFKNVNVNTGLVKQLYQTLLRIHESNLDLNNLTLADNADLETKNKLHDLRIIYKAFMTKIKGKFSTKNDVQLELNKLLAKKRALIQQSIFYFSDFSHFTLQEEVTIKLLMRYAKNVTLAFKTKLGQLNSDPQAGNYDYVIQRTINSLLKYLKNRQISYRIQTYPISSRPSSREILNAAWTGSIPAPGQLKQVQLVKADSRYAEAYFVARTIYQQVALAHYRYRDFLVLAPDLNEYETYLVPILKQNKIPYFIDLQQEMKYHPLVVLIESLRNLLKRPLATHELLTILKTHLLIPSWYHDEAAYVHDVDELENFVLAHGINHHLWEHSFTDFLKAEVINLDKMPDEVGRIDRLRSFLISKVTALLSALKKEKDSRKGVTLFFNFLADNGIAKRLEKWRAQANQIGDLQQAEQPEQLWNLLINLLKDYLLINPEKFEVNAFFEMLVTAFRQANFSQIPSTLDAVNISEIGMVQNTGYKQVFIIGATSTNLPNIEKTPDFLSSANLAQMTFNDSAYLEDDKQLNNLDQNYQFGLALSLASDRIYLSYPVLNAANEQLEPSIFYQRLKRSHAPEMAQHDLPNKIQDLLSFVTNPQSTLGYLTYLNSTQPSQEIKNLLTLTQKREPLQTRRVLAASHFKNKPVDIGSKPAQELYGQNLNSSVSQLETYYQNSYEYFLTYGLRLHRRFENEFDVIQAGNYFHETFDRLVKEMNEAGVDLAALSPKKLEDLLDQARRAMREEGSYAQLRNDPFNKYLFRCLDRTTSRVARNWRRNVKETPLRAKYSELGFGLGERVEGLNFRLSNLRGKHQVNLRGKIDRVDLAAFKNKNQVLAQVIDYKSSAKKFDLGLFYNGIALQMVSYLDILKKNKAFFAGSNSLSLLGAFYQTITRELERLNSKTVINSEMEVKPDLLNSKTRLLYKGLITNNPDLLTEAEPLLKDKKGGSDLYSGLKTKVRGGFSLPRNSNFSDQEISLLLRYDEFLIKRASSEILSGKLKLNPYRYGKGRSALTYSYYKDIFFFDAMLRENQYHEIERMDKKELLDKIKDTLEGKEQD